MKESRKWSRLLDDADSQRAVMRTLSELEWDGQIIDQSVDGVCLLVPRDADVAVGDIVRIALPEAPRQGEVRHVQPRGLMLRLGICFC